MQCRRETKRRRKTMQWKVVASQGNQNTDGKPYNARMRQARGNRSAKPNLYAWEDRLGKQCMQCKLLWMWILGGGFRDIDNNASTALLTLLWSPLINGQTRCLGRRRWCGYSIHWIDGRVSSNGFLVSCERFPFPSKQMKIRDLDKFVCSKW